MDLFNLISDGEVGKGGGNMSILKENDRKNKFWDFFACFVTSPRHQILGTLFFLTCNVFTMVLYIRW